MIWPAQTCLVLKCFVVDIYMRKIVSIIAFPHGAAPAY